MLLPVLALLVLRLIAWLSSPGRRYRRLAGQAPSHTRRPAKPAWVRREVIRLKALMLHAQYRVSTTLDLPARGLLVERVAVERLEPPVVRDGP